MKKVLLGVVLALCLTTQIAQAQRFTAGAIAGLATTQVYGDDLYGFYKFGPYLGLSVSAPIGNRFSIQGEIAYIAKGSRTNTEKDSTFFYQMSLGYFEIPLLLQYKTKSKLVVEAGPSVAFLISHKEENLYGETPSQVPFKPIEIGFCGGMMYPIYKDLQLNVRLSNSLLPIRDNVIGVHGNVWRGQYNVVLSFTLRYYFNKNND